jgi:hypothetical protein
VEIEQRSSKNSTSPRPTRLGPSSTRMTHATAKRSGSLPLSRALACRACCSPRSVCSDGGGAPDLSLASEVSASGMR